MVNGQTTRYYYTGGVVLYTANSQHVLQSENILTPSGNTIASKRFSAEYANKWYFFQYDVRGSVTNIVDPNGNMVKGYNYDTFGKKTDRGNANFDNEITYTSSVYDKASNLQYMNARFYDTDTGRFISQDSYAGSAAEPWTQHLYSYCGNNPVNYIDPTGHAPVDALDQMTFWNLVKMQNNGSTLNQAQQSYVNKIGGQIKEQAAVTKPKSGGGGNSTPAPAPSPSPNSSASPQVTPKPSREWDNSPTPTPSPSQSKDDDDHIIGGTPIWGPPNSGSWVSKDIWRWFGEDGGAQYDHHYGHPHHHPDLPSPHEHDWGRDENGNPKREVDTHEPRQPLVPRPSEDENNEAPEDDYTDEIITVVTCGAVLWFIFKATVAIALVPETGGASLGLFVLP